MKGNLMLTQTLILTHYSLYIRTNTSIIDIDSLSLSSSSDAAPSSLEYKEKNNKIHLKMNLEVGEHISDPSIVLSDYEISGVLIVKKRKFDVVDEQEEVHAQEQEAVVVESEVSSEATEEYNSESDIEKELDINNEEEEVEIVGVNVPPLKNVAVPHKAISGTYRKVKPDNEFFRVIADQLYGDERWCLVIRHFCYHYLQLKFPKM
jgi:hypothetical protein